MERTRALEWKQDKKYLDYIDSEKCFLSERQEGEEKAIMKNLRLKKVSIKDLDQIRALYWRLLDSSPKYGQILQWKKNIYPESGRRRLPWPGLNSSGAICCAPSPTTCVPLSPAYPAMQAS